MEHIERLSMTLHGCCGGIMIASLFESMECVGLNSHEHAILQAAETRLRQSLNSGAGTIECSFRDGSVVLKGHLPNWHQKQLAQEAVMNVVGVESLTNDIRVISL